MAKGSSRQYKITEEIADAYADAFHSTVEWWCCSYPRYDYVYISGGYLNTWTKDYSEFIRQMLEVSEYGEEE